MKKNNLALTFLGLVAIIASVGLFLEGTGSLNPTSDVVGYGELTGEVILDKSICVPVTRDTPPLMGACCDARKRCSYTAEGVCFNRFGGIHWYENIGCGWFGGCPY